jgi:hypothetical protein
MVKLQGVLVHRTILEGLIKLNLSYKLKILQLHLKVELDMKKFQ